MEVISYKDFVIALVPFDLLKRQEIISYLSECHSAAGKVVGVLLIANSNLTDLSWHWKRNVS